MGTFRRGGCPAPEIEGVGLGLAIVEDVASGHGWMVTVAKSESGSAQFEFAGVDWQ